MNTERAAVITSNHLPQSQRLTPRNAAKQLHSHAITVIPGGHVTRAFGRLAGGV